MRKIKVRSDDVLEFGPGVRGVQIIVPASMGRTAMCLEVDHSGTLCFAGGDSIIGQIIKGHESKNDNEKKTP